MQQPERGRVERAVRGAEQARARPAEQFDAGDLFEQLFVLVVGGQRGHHRMRLGVVADDVARAQLQDGARREVPLLLADREERGVHVVAVEHAHQLLGVGAGAVVERERELVAAAIRPR